MNESIHLTCEQVREMFDYEPNTGILRWRIKKARNVAAGRAAGCTGHGYVRVRIDGRLYLAHRLIWLHVHGEWPVADIDHRDRDPSNNRLDNLRLATRSQNHANRPKSASNTSGFKGVWWQRHDRKWKAHISINGKTRHLGTYATAEAAHAAYAAAAREHFGDFARTA